MREAGEAFARDQRLQGASEEAQPTVKGERCTFAHEWGSLGKHSRCFACSSPPEGPTLKSQSEGSNGEKDKKISS